MVGMAQAKGDLCKEVRCHHILINLFLGWGLAPQSWSALSTVDWELSACASVSHMVCPCRSSYSQHASLDTYACNTWWDEIFSLLERSPMRRVGVSSAGCISIPARHPHSHTHPLSASLR